jgi:plasmid stability protein
MSKMIQIRNVPEDMHRELKARAAKQGMSLSDFLRLELARIIQRPTREEILARLAALPPVRSEESAADAVRAEREGR